jgi:hypothetical protein
VKSHHKRVCLLFAAMTFLLTACDNFQYPGKSIGPNQEKTNSTVVSQPQNSESTRTDEIRQWADFARASTQYGDPNWAASQATGKPDVLECGDNSKAWASKKDNSVEWIELTYPTPVLPLEINIYQNFNPSQVVEVMLISPDGKRNIAWEGYPERVKNCPDLMTIAVENGRNIPANKIRITVDQQVNGWGWNEIDAVELVGKPVFK